MSTQHPQPRFIHQWWLIQVFGAISIAIATQAIVTLIMPLLQVDNSLTIFALRFVAAAVSSILQGYLQWQLLKPIVKSLDRRWIYTPMIGLPINVLTWILIQLSIKIFVFDEDGTVPVILAIVGAVGGATSGAVVGNLQKSLFKQSLYWRSLWHDWDREQVLAGALSGVISSTIVIGSVVLCGDNWFATPLIGLLCSIALTAAPQAMYGLIIGDTIYNVFKQAKLVK